MKSSSHSQPGEPFFMIFPWVRGTGIAFLLALVFMTIYRLSQTGGAQVHEACLPAMVVAGAGGLAGLYAIGKTWGRDVYWVLAGVMIGCNKKKWRQHFGYGITFSNTTPFERDLSCHRIMNGLRTL